MGIMERCDICCLPYLDDSSDLSNQKPDKVKKSLPCKHVLCESCYLRLDKTTCPFCRNTFVYSTTDIKKRNNLKLDYYKWQPPSQITYYIPPEVSRITTLPQLPNNTRNRINSDYEPFSRVRKNMKRRR